MFARNALLGATRRLPMPPARLPASTPFSFARSFTSTQLRLTPTRPPNRFPPSFFQSHRPGLNSLSGPSASQSNARRAKWTYARHGLMSPTFAHNHPWLAVVARLVMAMLVGSSILLLIVLIHDACTYSQKHVDRVPVNPLALAPRRGGPKNLPIIEVNIDDEESDEKSKCEGKPRVVILGGGWGVSPPNSMY